MIRTCLFLLALACAAPPAAAEPSAAALDSLVSPAERGPLLAELGRVDPPERLRELAAYGRRQSDLGGGFYGMMPDQLTDAAAIPVPADDAGRLAAAVHLARQRRTNLEALTRTNPLYPVDFLGERLGDYLARIDRENPLTGDPGGARLDLTLDVSAVAGFFDALDDGAVSAAEAAALAALPGNRESLAHRRNLGYVPEPLPDAASLAQMIMMAGSADPVDRLWCWLNPQNAFSYADLAGHAADYRALLADLEVHGDDLTRTALARVALHTPADVEFDATFALTAGWGIRGWATPAMAGLNIEQVKDDWRFLLGTLIEETYHRLQLRLFPTATGEPARDFAEMVAAATGDERYDRLHEVLAYTVAEGAANLVRGPFAAPEIAGGAPAGAELLERFVAQVVENGDVAAADALINEGLRGNGPLYGLGWKLAWWIERTDGPRAVGAWQRRGPAAFFLHGARLAAEAGEPLVAPRVLAAAEELAARDAGQ